MGEDLRVSTHFCRWSFLHSAEAIRKQEFTETLPRASIQDLGVILAGAGYEVFVLLSYCLLLSYGNFFTSDFIYFLIIEHKTC